MREISVIKGRILQFLESKGITKYTFYKVTGVANGILSQTNGISEDTLRRFLRNFEEVNGDWLLRGEGPMLRTWIYPTNQADEPDKERLNDVFATYNGKYVSGKMAGIPVVDLRAAAETEIASHAAGETVTLPQYDPAGSPCLCFRTEGEAMYPTVLEGSYIVCRLLPEEEWTQIDDMTACVLVTKDRKCYIRRLKVLQEEEGGFLSIADNQDHHNYPPLRFGKEDLYRIWKIEWYMTPKLLNSNDTCSEKVKYLEQEVCDLKQSMNRLLPPQK